MLIGLTGGIGSGKSEVAKIFESKGIDLIDTDNVAKKLLDINGDAYSDFLEIFGKQYLYKDGTVNRDLLRKEIFSDPLLKIKLEEIIHPKVKNKVFSFISKSKSDYQIVVVPLMFETKSYSAYDRILLIDSSVENQIKRASSRDGASKKEIMSIINSQASREQRKSIATDVIENNTTIEFLYEEVLKLHDFYIQLSNEK